MDFADIQKVNILSQEKAAIQEAMSKLDAGGRIVAMTVGPDGDRSEATLGLRWIGTTVPTAYIDYPAQMVDAIKTAFQGRLRTIQEELTKLGVTGVG